MLVMRTTEDPTDPIRKLISSKQSVGFDDLALGVYPLGLYDVEPRTTLLRKKATYDPHSIAAFLDPRSSATPSQRAAVPAPPCTRAKTATTGSLPAG
jgi:hypothetical protein